MPAVESEHEGLQRAQSRCSGRGESPCQFATCMNNMAAIAERIIATSTSIKVLLQNDIVVNRPHHVGSKSSARFSKSRKSYVSKSWPRYSKSCARYSKSSARYSKSWEFNTGSPLHVFWYKRRPITRELYNRLCPHANETGCDRTVGKGSRESSTFTS